METSDQDRVIHYVIFDLVWYNIDSFCLNIIIPATMGESVIATEDTGITVSVCDDTYRRV